MQFNELNLTKPLLNALDDLGIKTPTVIQEKVYAAVMSGRDICGIAQTGTGKTFAYLLPALRQLEYSEERNTRILVIVPTRELVMQVTEEVKKLSTYMNLVVVGVYGGVNLKPQAVEVNEGCDILVGTPGRLVDLLTTGILRAKTVKKVILDEFDEMLEQGLRAQIKVILELLPERRQNLMFSSTITEEVETLINTYFKNILRIEATPVGTPLENITQTLYRLPNFNTKINLIQLMLNETVEMTKVLIFVSSKHLANLVYEHLSDIFGSSIHVIHSGKAQNQRFSAVNDFQNGLSRVLIATDVIARGIDVNEVSHVINFDLPDTPEIYIHRIGRTGRKERKGNAISFVMEREAEYLLAIEKLMKYQIPELALPQDLLISDKFILEEEPKIPNKSFKRKKSTGSTAGPAFHAKSAKNSKVNVRRDREAELKKKYGKSYRKNR